MFTNVMEASSF